MKLKQGLLTLIITLTLIIPTLTLQAWEVGDPVIDGYNIYMHEDEVLEYEVRKYYVGSSWEGIKLQNRSMYFYPKDPDWVIKYLASDFRMYYSNKSMSGYNLGNMKHYVEFGQGNYGSAQFRTLEMDLYLNPNIANKGYYNIPKGNVVWNTNLSVGGYTLGAYIYGGFDIINSFDDIINSDVDLFKAGVYYKLGYEIVDSFRAHSGKWSNNYSEVNETLIADQTNKYDYYLLSRVGNIGESYAADYRKQELELKTLDGTILYKVSNNREVEALTPLNLSSDQSLKASAIADSWNEGTPATAEGYLVRKLKPLPKVTEVRNLTIPQVGENTKIRYRITTLANYPVNVTVKAKIGNNTQSKVISSGTGTIDLEWDSSTLGEGTFKEMEITVENSPTYKVTTTHIMNTDVKYVLKDTTNQLIGQISPKSNLQRTVFVGVGDRVIDSNAKNNAIVDALGTKLKNMGVDLYITGTDNAVWKRLAQKFE